MKLTDHFTLEEFTRSTTANRLKINNSVPDHLMNNIRLSAIKLELVRKELDKSIVITSGYRCPMLNSRVGGVYTSAHTQGLAVDFKSSFGTPKEICQKLRLAYNADNMKMETINRNAKALLDNNKIATRISQLNKNVAKRHNVTVDSLMNELDEIKKIALNALTPQTSAAVSAVMGKAKLSGLDKQIIEQTNFNVNANVPLSSLFGDNNDED